MALESPTTIYIILAPHNVGDDRKQKNKKKKPSDQDLSITEGDGMNLR